MTCIFMRDLETGLHTGEDGDRDWSAAAISQGKPLLVTCRSWEGGME